MPNQALNQGGEQFLKYMTFLTKHLDVLLHCRHLLFCYRSDHAAGREEEAAFLSTLRTLWRGFIHMHSVAKLVTKAFPVSGVLDNLSEVEWLQRNLFCLVENKHHLQVQLEIGLQVHSYVHLLSLMTLGEW